jgi:hypothetical protein
MTGRGWIHCYNAQRAEIFTLLILVGEWRDNTVKLLIILSSIIFDVQKAEKII